MITDDLPRILVGDCLLVMRTLDANSVDAIVTDPPYGLGFMGKGWDHDVPGEQFWREALRVAKPGAWLVAFGGTRKFHRLACYIEDAGWELRDNIGRIHNREDCAWLSAWTFGSGFPKSLDVSKAIDKADDYKLQAAIRRAAVAAVEAAGLTLPGNSRHDWTVGEHAPGDKWWAEFQTWLPGLTDEQRERVEGEIVATIQKSAGWFTNGDIYNIRAPASAASQEWEGWGTALKPAWEPIILARKPLQGTVAANVLRYGTGALNIDACRIGNEVLPAAERGVSKLGTFEGADGNVTPERVGRWPANVIHDGSDEVVAMFPAEAGAAAPVHKRNGDKFRNSYGAFEGNIDEAGSTFQGDSGSAARFFYTAKASREDRNDGCDGMAERPLLWSSGTQNPGSFHAEGTKRAAANNHPTVKPTELMRYLCRLVTPPGGLVLDPFCGSGSTGRGAIAEGFRFVGIELDENYARIAEARLRVVQPGLPFGNAA